MRLPTTIVINVWLEVKLDGKVFGKTSQLLADRNGVIYQFSDHDDAEQMREYLDVNGKDIWPEYLACDVNDYISHMIVFNPTN